MRIHVETRLPCSVEQAWDALQTTACLMSVTPGNRDVSVVSPRPMPARWTEARRIVLRLPGLGERTIDILQIDAGTHTIRTRERDAVVRRWDHTMTIRPAPRGHAFYADTVEIEAGILTLPVYLAAQALYRYRHRGWLRIARRQTRDGDYRPDQSTDL